MRATPLESVAAINNSSKVSAHMTIRNFEKLARYVK